MAKKVALFVFIALLPWIFFDIDLGDQAYNNVGAWLMANHPKMPHGTLPFWFEVIPIWGSMIPNYFAFKLFGPQCSLIVLRLLWIFWHVGIALASYFTFKRLFKTEKLATAVALTALACTIGGEHFSLNYNTVSVGFGVLSVGLLAVSLTHTQSRLIFLLSSLSGFFAVFSICSRMTVVVFFGLYWFLTLLLLKIKKEQKTSTLILGMITGCLMGSLFAYGFLLLSGQNTYFVNGVKGFIDGVLQKTDFRYSVGGSSSRLLGHYYRIAIGAGLFFLLLKVTSLPMRKKINHLLMGLIFILLVIASSLKYGVVLAIVIGGSLYTIIWSALVRRFKFTTVEWVFITGSFFILFSFPVGTYLDGIQNYKYGLWIVLPLALKLATEQTKLAMVRKLLPLCVLVLFLVTRVNWPTFPYHEKPIYKMMTAFRTPQLRGLFSYPEKAKALDDLFYKLKELGLKPGHTLLCYNGALPLYAVSMIYQTTQTIPFLHDAAIVEYRGARWKKHLVLLTEHAQKGTLPQLIVRQKQQFAGADFSKNTPFTWTTPEENDYRGEMDQIVRMAGFRVAWENSFFVILNK